MKSRKLSKIFDKFYPPLVDEFIIKYRTITNIFFTTGEIIFSETLRLINFVSIAYNKKLIWKFKKFLYEISFLLIFD